MKTNKNIDRLFQEKLKDMEITPPDIVWDAIEKAISDKKKRRVIPLWLRYGAAAAILLLMTIGTVNYFNDSSEIEIIENTIVDSDVENSPIINENTIENPIDESSETQIVTIASDETNVDDNSTTDKVSFKKEQKIDLAGSKNDTKNTIATSSQKEKTQIENKNIADLNPKEDIQIVEPDNTIANNNSSEANNATVLEEKPFEGDLETLNSMLANDEPLIVDADKDLVEEEDGSDSQWSVASVIAPIYFNSFNSNSSPIDSKFNDNSKESNTTFSYGIKVGYQLNKKFTLLSGVNIVNLSYSTNEISVTSSLDHAKMKNVKYLPSASIVDVRSISSVNSVRDASSLYAAAGANETLASSPASGTLNQEFGYIEIPVEVKYNLIGGKFGVNLVGGFSTLILNNNQITVVSEDLSIDLGEASNINSINFSGNLGVDLDYKINKNMFINVAPTIKIQTNTFSQNAEGFSPYFLGIYTGLNYKF